MFRTIEDIETWLNENGYFLNTETNILMVKTGKELSQAKSIRQKTIVNHYLNNKTINIDGFLLLLDRINSNIGNLNLFIDKNNLPIARLNMSIVKKYHQRNIQIKQHQEHLEQLKSIDYVFTVNNYTEHKKYYVIKGDKCIEINKDLVDFNKKLLQVNFIVDTEKALKDDLINHYALEYDKLVDRYNKIQAVNY